MALRTYVDRIALTANQRTQIIPNDNSNRRHVWIGNVANGDLHIDVGDPTRYFVITASGWDELDFDPHTPADSPDGVSFYATSIPGGTLVLRWT